jgi:hypothetical protein
MVLLNNLDSDDVNALEEFFRERQKINQKIKMNLFSQASETEHADIHSKISVLIDEVRALNTKLDNIFGRYVLLNCSFVDIKKHLYDK